MKYDGCMKRALAMMSQWKAVVHDGICIQVKLSPVSVRVIIISNPLCPLPV